MMEQKTQANLQTPNRPDRHLTPGTLLLPLISTGLLMAAYLLVRPYGDSPTLAPEVRAAAFASPRWIIAHLAGALALVSFARFALRFSDAHPRSTAVRLARWSGLGGVVLVLLYYGAETFALHVIGRQAAAGDLALLELVEQIRNLPAALVAFGVGLLLLAVSGITTAIAWRRITGSLAAWPLGLAYLAAAVVLAVSIKRSENSHVLG